jgi:hypothetical protein
MTRVLLVMAGLAMLGAAPATAQDIPEGTFASSKEGCDRLATNTPDQLGENFDFHIITKTGSAAYGQSCDFVNVTARNATSWLATAFCDDEGYIYPDLFAIAQKEDGTLSVTRSTDAGPVDALEEPADGEDLPADDLDPAELGNDRAAASKRQDETASAFETSGAFNTYIRCDKVKE